VWNPTVTRSPATDVPQSDAEKLGDVLLREAERAKHLAEFNRSRVARFHVKLHRHNLPDSHTGNEQTADGVMDAPTLMDSRGRCPSPPEASDRDSNAPAALPKAMRGWNLRLRCGQRVL
jgi:hypothetical protein